MPNYILPLSLAAGVLLLGQTALTVPHDLPSAAPTATTDQAQTADTVTVTTQEINTSHTPNLIVKAKLPVLSGMQDEKAQRDLNDKIAKQAAKDIADWEQRADADIAAMKQLGFTPHPYELWIQYEVTADGGVADDRIFSMKVTTYGQTPGTGMPRIDTYNFYNDTEARPVTLEDLFGGNYKERINLFIKQKIAEHPEDYFPDDFESISDTQNFYIENGEAVIVFDKYAIAPGVMGNPEFRLAIPK